MCTPSLTIPESCLSSTPGTTQRVRGPRYAGVRAGGSGWGGGEKVKSKQKGHTEREMEKESQGEILYRDAQMA